MVMSKQNVFQYAIKFVCGKSDGIVVAPGEYWTAINVHNPTSVPVRFKKKIAIGLPKERPGPVSQFFDTKLGPDEAFEIDRNDIFEHANTNLNFIKGFVIIETAFELDVVAVYTAAGANNQVETLHVEHVSPRQILLGLPDLVPIPNENGSFCKGQTPMLQVTVKNQGTGPAGPSTTKVDFFQFGSATMPTPHLGPGASVDLNFQIPPGCHDPDCEFRITVDAGNDVVESDEGNNTASDTCIG